MMNSLLKKLVLIKLDGKEICLSPFTLIVDEVVNFISNNDAALKVEKGA
ncbi:hypothetical protein [Ruegeria sp. SCP11]